MPIVPKTPEDQDVIRHKGHVCHSAANPPFQPMPLRVNKIGAILAVRIDYNAFSIYWRGTAEWQTVGRHLIISESNA